MSRYTSARRSGSGSPAPAGLPAWSGGGLELLAADANFYTVSYDGFDLPGATGWESEVRVVALGGAGEVVNAALGALTVGGTCDIPGDLSTLTPVEWRARFLSGVEPASAWSDWTSGADLVCI
jgi:hypothetical protein